MRFEELLSSAEPARGSDPGAFGAALTPNAELALASGFRLNTVCILKKRHLPLAPFVREISGRYRYCRTPHRDFVLPSKAKTIHARTPSKFPRIIVPALCPSRSRSEQDLSAKTRIPRPQFPRKLTASHESFVTTPLGFGPLLFAASPRAVPVRRNATQFNSSQDRDILAKHPLEID
jgi:hypothetical protein